MKPSLLLSLSAVLICAPSLAQTGASMADVVATTITDASEAQKQTEDGRAVRVSVSALRQIGGENELVTALRSGQVQVPATGEATILDFDEHGLDANISVLRDYRGEVVIVLDATGSILDTSCALEADNQCFKALSSYPAREQLLLRPGINNIRVGDYRLTVKVEGKLSI